jgi:hypothetical protein
MRTPLHTADALCTPKLRAGPATGRPSRRTLPLSRALSLLAAAALSTTCAAAPEPSHRRAIGPVRPAPQSTWRRKHWASAERGGLLVVADAAAAKSAEQAELDASLAESQILGPVFVIAQLAGNLVRSARAARRHARLHVCV